LLAAPPLSDALTTQLHTDLDVRANELTAWAEEREATHRAASEVNRQLAQLGQRRRASVEEPRTNGRTALERASAAVRSLTAPLAGLDTAWAQLHCATDVPVLPTRGPELTHALTIDCTDVDLTATVTSVAERLSAAIATIEMTCAAVNAGLRHAQDGIDRALADAGVPSAAVLQEQLASTGHHLRDAQSREKRALVQQPVAKGLDEGLRALRARLAVLQSLKELMSPSRFPNYVVEERQIALLRIASSLLAKLTRDGYGFGEDFMIVDRRTGQPRHPKTLSGGETFLASLALALALVEISNRSGGQLDCLFLDEGFGSLDSSVLGETLDVLREQAAGGRLVGVISHLHAVAAELDDVLVVTKAIDGSDFRWLDATERDQYLLDDVTSGLLG